VTKSYESSGIVGKRFSASGEMVQSVSERNESLTIPSPGSSEDYVIFFTNVAITVTEVRAGVRRSLGAPSVTISLMHNTDRGAVGNQVLTAATAITNEAGGQDVAIGGDTTIPADSYVWLESSAASGSPNELYITMFYTED
jgi:hypothetical protein